MIYFSKKIVIWAVIIAVAVVFAFLYKPGFVRDLLNYNLPRPTSLPTDSSLDFLTLPDGFAIRKFADGLDGPRVITFDSKDRMLVSETKAGRVIKLEDTDGDGSAETKTVLLKGLRSPHGLAFYEDPKTKKVYLYVAETHQVVRYVYNVKDGDIDEAQKTAPQNIANLPADGRHFTRTIAFGPNFRKEQIVAGQSEVNTQVPTKLYISVGSSCDVCVETETWKRAAILESDPDGKYTAEFAGGLRNSVFFTFHPETKEIWATDMGRDNLGDNLPPDEVNIIKVAEKGNKFGALRYGWPFCYGDKIRDKTFNPSKVDRIDIPTDCNQTESAAIELPAHSAPLGLAFITKDGGWPTEWRNDLLVAYHGSWNRSEPTGYKIVKFKVNEKGQSSGVEDFISGWLATNNQQPTTNNQIYGRPVDLKFGPGGNTLYISDDSAGVIYRVEPK
ncbi:MAG: PQQ-dependent sugar dehydrogenase [Candidatus Yanofskybacteria bacterium]|nr:PQQ-dependent sugar dehydrogenase [Candidatus Yanofskybacteria bacterium]